MTLTTKDAAVLALLSKGNVPSQMKQAMLKRLTGEAKKIALNLTGEHSGSLQVREAADALRKFNRSASRR